MEKTSRPSAPISCRHLGLADNPFEHHADANDEHRCYLWMQRDRIDLDHQKGYCLSGRYRDCPWLHISLPCQPRVKEVWQETVVCAMSDTGRRMWPLVVAVSKETGRFAAARALSLGVWAKDNLPAALGWVLRQIPPLARGLGNGIERGARLAIRTAATSVRRPGSKPAIPVVVPAETEDLDTLMRLGREASKAGDRNQAHLYFSRAAALDPASEEAWLWTAATAEDSQEALGCLGKALAINPSSGRARAQVVDIAEPAPQRERGRRGAVKEGATAPRLVKKGIAALDAGSEDEAYQLFAEATDIDKTNEAAWYWRAKTATDLNEVVRCLDRVLELNPRNEKARASLDWAMDRQRTNVNRARGMQAPQSRPIVPALYSKSQPAPRPLLLQLASAAYMVLGILWVGPVVLPTLGGPFASLYEKVGILPTLDMPYLSPSVVLGDTTVPDFNLLYALPLLVAVLSFVAMEIIWNDGGFVSLYLVLVAAISIVTVDIFGPGRTGTIPLMGISAAAGIFALGGRIISKRQTRTRLVPTIGPAVTRLTKTASS